MVSYWTWSVWLCWPEHRPPVPGGHPACRKMYPFSFQCTFTWRMVAHQTRVEAMYHQIVFLSIAWRCWKPNNLRFSYINWRKFYETHIAEVVIGIHSPMQRSSLETKGRDSRILVSGTSQMIEGSVQGLSTTDWVHAFDVNYAPVESDFYQAVSRTARNKANAH